MFDSLENLNAASSEQSPLAKLHEISPPEDISWLPQTLGWQLILLCIVAYSLYRVYLMYDKWLKNAYRREAISYLNSLGSEPADIVQIPVIIKRAALYGFNREEVAQLGGKDWESWLDKNCHGVSFSSQLTGVLSHLAYSPKPSISKEQLDELKSQVSTWVSNHGGHYG
ncbi:DUF4381 domain-containing protein [Colwelliaceae bacterium BS250]